MPDLFRLCVILVCAVGCRGPNWQSGPALLFSPRQVARALDDPLPIARRGAALGVLRAAAAPAVEPPGAVRPCCAFGMDLRPQVGGVLVPGVRIANVTTARELGPHEYNNGTLTVQAQPGRVVLRERDGLIYTCRGGFIDSAHVRDNADRVLYAAAQLLRWLPAANAGGTTFDFPEEGTARRVIVKPVPPDALRQVGRLGTAAALAGYIDYQLALWHEIVTWYGWESQPGFSERVSAFSLEDRYSNVLGLRLGMGLVEDRDIADRDDYNRSMDGWLQEALRRLYAVGLAEGRGVMAALDGRWWDSRQMVPDFALVRRRDLGLASPVRGWLASAAFPAGQAPRAVTAACAGIDAPPLPLEVPQALGGHRLADLVTIEFRFTGWVPARFPLPVRAGSVVTQADFEKILDDVRQQGQRELGPRFDRPLD